MNKRNRSRVTALFVCLFLLLAALLATAYLAAHAGHSCGAEEQCQICAYIHQGRTLLRALRSLLWFLPALSLAGLAGLLGQADRIRPAGPDSLLALRVRLNQ